MVIELARKSGVETEHFFNNTALIEIKWMNKFCPNAKLIFHTYDRWNADVPGILALYKAKFDRRRPELDIVACDRNAR